MLIAALTAFVGTHFLLSHPFRAPLVKTLGPNGFLGVYAVVALGTFAWVVQAFGAAPVAAPLWTAGDGAWALASFLMLVGCILFVGSLFGNPSLPGPPERANTARTASGVFAITRHPMMWGFALWALVHMLVSPQPKVLALTIAIGFLALFGSVGQDAKKAALMGDGWRDWARRTSFLPFANQISGRGEWGTAWPGRTVVLAGIAFWLIASYVHPLLGGPVAGVWRWMGG
jgi:uncharacterized membrane protein